MRSYVAFAVVCLFVLVVRHVAAPGPISAGAVPTKPKTVQLAPGFRSSTPKITPAARAGTLRFAPSVAPADRAWILAAIASARPEARRLIAEVDGLIELDTKLNVRDGVSLTGGDGVTWMGLGTVGMSLDGRKLNGERAIDRTFVVLHELGHVIDFVLIDRDLRKRLDAGIPPGGEVRERFADTFAKWALDQPGPPSGAGYGIPMPASIADWGAPLSQMAGQL
jgi:hypothetical protein